MEISAVMNIHELAMNRTLKQRADAQAKKNQEPVAGKALHMEKIIVEQANAKEKAQTETPKNGHAVDILM